MKQLLQILLRITLLLGIIAADPPRPSVQTSIPPLSLFPAMAPTTQLKDGCPRREDIHPCECLEIPKQEDSGIQIETVVFCKTIRNSQVLQNAMKGMQGHIVDFMVLDSCKLPPFPNGLFFNIGIKWMEILNSTVQLKTTFFQCANNCCLWRPMFIPFIRRYRSEHSYGTVAAPQYPFQGIFRFLF